jgi:hypothetical protein
MQYHIVIQLRWSIFPWLGRGGFFDLLYGSLQPLKNFASRQRTQDDKHLLSISVDLREIFPDLLLLVFFCFVQVVPIFDVCSAMVTLSSTLANAVEDLKSFPKACTKRFVMRCESCNRSTSLKKAIWHRPNVESMEYV